MILSGTGYLLLNKERTDRQLSATMMELEAQARVDALTGLANRRTMNHYLRFSLSENRRRAEPVAVLMIDIDHFKRFNDVYGHIAGDKCLQAVAEEIRRHCRRSTDLAARFGGEEFLFIMWDIENDEALRVADGIREGVRALGIEHAYSDADSVVTISIGVFSAIPDDEGATEEWYIEQADKRLYEAKKSGRNRCCAASRQ
jgi:diguanylate cyclase (GGDEF)-like protein